MVFKIRIRNVKNQKQKKILKVSVFYEKKNNSQVFLSLSKNFFTFNFNPIKVKVKKSS